MATFGCDPGNFGGGDGTTTAEAYECAGKFTTTSEAGEITAITAEIRITTTDRYFQCGIYDSAGNIITNGLSASSQVLAAGGTYQTIEFSFDTNPTLTASTTYYFATGCPALAGDGNLRYDSATGTQGLSDTYHPNIPPLTNSVTFNETASRLMHIYVTYTPSVSVPASSNLYVTSIGSDVTGNVTFTPTATTTDKNITFDYV